MIWETAPVGVPTLGLLGLRLLSLARAAGAAFSLRRRAWIFGATLLSILMVAAPSVAVDLTETQKLIAGDPAAGDSFGQSVAVSPQRIVVGARNKDVMWGPLLVPGMGAVYVFERNEVGAWEQANKLTAFDGTDGRLGHSVAVSGDVVFAGAPNENAVYIFARDSEGDWPHFQKITVAGVGPDDQFGASLAVSGNSMIVGTSPVPTPPSGQSVFFFDYDTESEEWKEAGAHTSPLVGDHFGESVAIFGDLAVVGAKLDDHAGSQAGAAHVFARTAAGSWVQETVLRSDEIGPEQEFGHSVAVRGDIVFASASRLDLGGSSGKAYIFDRADGAWKQRQVLTAEESTVEGGEFGFSVGLEESVALASDTYSFDPTGTGSNEGAVIVFTSAGSDESDDWTKYATLRASDRESFDSLGSAVALSGDIVVAGVPNKDVALFAGGVDAGAVYVFELGVAPVPAINGLSLVWLAALLSIVGTLLLTHRRLRLI